MESSEMPDKTETIKKPSLWRYRLKQLVAPVVILLMAGGIVVLIAGNWNTWASERVSQKTDDAYVRADLTPLSTKGAGLVATVAVSDYQPVKAGELLDHFRPYEFQATEQQDEASGASGNYAIGQSPRP